MRARVCGAGVLALACSACGDSTAVPIPDAAITSFSFEEVVPTADILFVVDDSTAMAPYQSRIAQLPDYLDTTLAVADLHVAVVTADPTAGGALRRSSAVAGPYVIDAPHFDGTRETNYSGTRASAIATLLATGTSNTTAPRALESLQAALTPKPDNVGFVRASAYLVIITIASGDSSAAAPMDYAMWVKTVAKSNAALVIASGIFPPGSARLAEFHAWFSPNDLETPLDAPDYQAAVQLPSVAPRHAPLTMCGYAAPENCAFVWSDRGVDHPLDHCAGVEPCWESVQSPACGFLTHGRINTEVQIHGWDAAYHPAIRGECTYPPP